MIPAPAPPPPALAQLVAPPLQPGPVRLPGAGPQPAPLTPRPPALEPSPGPAPEPPSPSGPAPTGPAPPAGGASSRLPRLLGFNPYSPAVLARLLAGCASDDPSEDLSRCATLLQARLFADGYINTRVRPQPPDALVVVAGRIETVEVVSSSPRLQRRLLRLLQPLKGSVLRLPSLTADLTHLQRLPGVGLLKSNLNRIGEDSSRAQLVVTAEPAARERRGEVALRNDGNGGSGQFRGLATVVEESSVVSGDALLLFGEVNSDSDPEIGTLNGSFSYRLPLVDNLSFTTAIGASRRTLVEAPQPLHDLSYRQLQLYNQLEFTLQESLRSRWTAFAGLSLNRNDAFFRGESIAVIPGGGEAGSLRTGFGRIGLGYDRTAGPFALNASLYGLQGIGAVSTEAQRQELDFLGVVPDAALAIGSEFALSWQLGPRWQLQGRAAGQLAFNPLTSPMELSLGSDNGLRGLPGQVVSGDSGLLGSLELAWLLWRGRRDALQVVPFIGAGGVWNELPGASLYESVGAGGFLLRWSHGPHGVLELGWVRQFQSGTPAFWDEWILSGGPFGGGLYSKLLYRF
ncbi:MAG: ShlB/FhaC/HecB family hemolysin secretion/activation protein [Cyanobium sp.]